MTNFFLSLAAKFVARDFSREEGQGIVEYALVLGVLVVGIFGFFALADIETPIDAAITAISEILNGTTPV